MKKFIFITGIAATLLPFAVSAQGLVPQCEGPNCTICDLLQLVHNVINYAMQLSFVLAIAMVVYGGYMMLTSAGSEEKVTSGRKIIWYAVLGLVLVLASWAMVNTFFLILVKAPSKLPWKWNEIPGSCGLPGISTNIKGPAVSVPATPTGRGVPRSIDVNSAGALEPQGPVGPQGQVPTAPAPGTFGAPEVQGPPRPDDGGGVQHIELESLKSF